MQNAQYPSSARSLCPQGDNRNCTLCTVTCQLRSMMRLAIDEAKKAAARDEVPIGAIITAGDRVVARAHNLTESLTDPTAHAEMQAITAACDTVGGKYLKECTIYVTVEPCPMCAAALRWAQIGAVVWGADDEKFGFSTISPVLLHPKTTTERGVLNEECAALMRDFFAKKR